MNTPKYRFLQEGADCLSNGDQQHYNNGWSNVVEKFFGMEAKPDHVYRRPVKDDGTDMYKPSERKDFPELDENTEYWKQVDLDPPKPLQVVAVCYVDRFPENFFAFIDDKGQWRNAHTKNRITVPIWWMVGWPPVPKEQTSDE